MKKIYITGCDNSGTDLLRLLFFSYESMAVIGERIGLKDFCGIADRNESKNMVGERVPGSILSGVAIESHIKRDLALISQNSIQVVNIVRDGRNVISNGSVWVNGYIAAVAQSTKLKKAITHQIKFEDIITHPEREQNKLAVALGLQVMHKWSSFPKFVKSEYDDSITLSDQIPNDDYKLSAPGLIGDFEKALAVNYEVTE